MTNISIYPKMSLGRMSLWGWPKTGSQILRCIIFTCVIFWGWAALKAWFRQARGWLKCQGRDGQRPSKHHCGAPSQDSSNETNHTWLPARYQVTHMIKVQVGLILFHTIIVSCFSPSWVYISVSYTASRIETNRSLSTGRGNLALKLWAKVSLGHKLTANNLEARAKHIQKKKKKYPRISC